MILANSTWGGWLAELRRARHLPQPGEPRAGRQGAHGHASRAARRASASRSTPGHLAAAPLRRPREPVADHRLRAPRPHRGAGRAVQAEGRASCSRSSPASTPPTPPTTASRSAIERYWTLRYLRAERRRTSSTATVMKDGLVRADDAAAGAAARSAPSAAARRAGARAHRRRSTCSRSTCTRSVVARLDDAAAPPTPAEADDAEDESRRPVRLPSRSTSTATSRRQRRPTAAAAGAAAVKPARCSAGSRPCRSRSASRSAVHAALLTVRFVDPRGLQPRLPGHAARGDPGQLALRRGARQGAGDRAGQPGRRRRSRERAAPPRRCRLRR